MVSVNPMSQGASLAYRIELALSALGIRNSTVELISMLYLPASGDQVPTASTERTGFCFARVSWALALRG